MSVPIVYPASLPGPTAAPFQPAERRLLSSLPGPRQSRPIQRDRKASQQLDFIFKHAEVAIFEAWLDGPLVRAGAWFAASWPQPQGGVGVRRFVGEPSFPVYYPGVGWHVSAQVEVRGRGELPVDDSDPCWPEVLVLMQRGVLVDTSSYARDLGLFGPAPSATEVGVDVPGFPSGLGTLINAQHNGSGIEMQSYDAPELAMGSLPRCYESFVHLEPGALSGGSQILFNDGYGFGGNMFFLADGTGRLNLRINSFTIAATAAVPEVEEDEDWYVCAQVGTDNSIAFWSGPVGDAVAVGAVSLATCPRPVVPPQYGGANTTGPFIGFVGGSGGVNNFKFDQYRVTACNRYTGPTIPIPARLFPEH
jgi:hypothetical protein